MKKINIEKKVTKKLDPLQKKRIKNILDLIRPNMKKIKADHLCNFENAHKVLALSAKLSSIHLNLANLYENNEVLKKCRKTEKWYLLHLINYYSATGQRCYKEGLAKHRLLRTQSAKTTYKDINDLIKDKIVIEMPEYTSDGEQNGYKNLRPAEDVAGAYIDWNVKYLLENINFLQDNTKINILLNMEDK